MNRTTSNYRLEATGDASPDFILDQMIDRLQIKTPVTDSHISDGAASISWRSTDDEAALAVMRDLVDTVSTFVNNLDTRLTTGLGTHRRLVDA